MPGLPNHSHKPPSFAHDHRESSVTRTLPPAKAASTNAMANKIKYLPPQMDTLASSTTEASRQRPFRLLINDAGVLASNLRYLPWIVLPFRTSEKSSELYPSPSNATDLALQGWLAVLEVTFLAAAVPVVLLLPGILSAIMAIVCCGIIYILSWPMQGPRIAYSMMDDITIHSANQNRNERWLFVNGVATGYDIAKLSM